MDFTDIASSKPDSSVAQVTSTLFAPMPPAMRRSAPDKSISPGSAGRVPSRPRCLNSAAIARATFSDTCCEYFCFAVPQGGVRRLCAEGPERVAEKIIGSGHYAVSLAIGSRVAKTKLGERLAVCRSACGECSWTDATVFCLRPPQPRSGFRCVGVSPASGEDA